MKTPLVVKMAYEIIELWEMAKENEKLLADKEYWRNEANQCVDNAIDHNQKMMGNLLAAVLDDKNILNHSVGQTCEPVED